MHTTHIPVATPKGNDGKKQPEKKHEVSVLNMTDKQTNTKYIIAVKPQSKGKR